MSVRVAVTGVGAISSLGNDWSEVKPALLSCQNRVRYMTEWDQYTELQTRLASPIDHFEMPSNYTQKKMRGMGRVAKLGVVATEKALKDAGLFRHEVISDGRTGVAFGSATGSSSAAMEFFNLLEHQSMSRINGTTYLRMMSHSAAVNISVLFGTTGRMYTTSSACTAGSQGIGYAYEAIRSGQQTVMLAGGAEELCPTQAAVFDTVYATSQKNATPNTSPCPYDKQRDGLVLGEGACTLILEEWSHAEKRGAKILAEVVGYGTNTDGSHLVRPNQSTMSEVMRLSLRDAGINAGAIDYISGHGTSTVHGDIAETLATESVLGRDTPISTIKSYIGHSLGACGSLEAWLAIAMMNEDWFSPNVNLKQIDDRCAALDYIVQEPRELKAKYVMSNNFAFGGINTSLIFKRV
ncbi:MAG: beta-ketoacyl-ACP synthase [Agarilytica sp.]